MTKLREVTIAIKKRGNIKESISRIKEINPNIKLEKIITLNQSCPDFNSSFVIFAKKFPIGIPKNKIIIPKMKLNVVCIG